MFIVLIRYRVPESEIDAQLDAHRAWLETHYETGQFLASGRQVPRTGGVILASGPDAEGLRRICATDPFHVHGLAEHEVIEVDLARTVPELASLR